MPTIIIIDIVAFGWRRSPLIFISRRTTAVADHRATQRRDRTSSNLPHYGRQSHLKVVLLLTAYPDCHGQLYMEDASEEGADTDKLA